MTPFFYRVFTTFNQLNIPYVLGAESLAGLSEGDMFNHSHNLRLYVFHLKPVKWLQLAIQLFRHGIILKPKCNRGHRFFKLRFKPSLLQKDPLYVKLTLLKPTAGGYTAFVGGHDTFFASGDLQQDATELIEVENIQVAVPRNYKAFVKQYSKELLAGFYEKHLVAFNSTSEKQAVDFMHKNIAIMQDTGISFWVEGGTLLGALRDQKLIPWDHDLDFGMKFESEAQMKRLIRNLRRHFYVSVRSFTKTDKLWQLGKYRVLKIYPRKNLIFRDDLCLDLFVYYEGTLPGSQEAVYKYVVWNRNAFHRKEFFDTRESLMFYGKEIPVPANPEKFIEVKYGKNWRTPIKEWNVALDDGSIYKSD